MSIRQKRKLRIALQTSSFRHLPLQTALSSSAELGVKEVEICHHHLKTTDDPKWHDDVRRMLRQHGLTMKSYGIVILKVNGDSNRKLFEFAKLWRLDTLVANPDPDVLDEAAALADEYGINVAIHNQGPRSLYPDAATLRAALKGRSQRLGLCLDTGHLLRVPGEDPVAVISEFSDRLHAVHLKDMDENHQEYILGQGRLDLPRVLQALRQTEFRGPVSVEYENRVEDPLPVLAESLKRIREAMEG